MAEKEELILNPIPPEGRTGWKAPLFNILGCNVAISELMVGGALIAGLSLKSLIGVSVAGNVLLVLILFFQGYIGCREGLNTYVLAQSAFGCKGGRMIIALILGITSFGWFGIQAGVAGLSVQKVFPSINLTLTVVVLGLLMMTFAAMGFKTMAVFNYVAVPPLIILMIWGVGRIVAGGNLEALWQYTPSNPISFTEGINSVVGLIIVGAIISPDYLRYTRGAKDILYIGFWGVAVISIFQQVAAGLIAMNAPSWNITEVLATQGFPMIAFLILLLAAWSTNLSNAYSGGLALKTLLPNVSRMTLTIIAGLIGTAIAASGIIFKFIDFLSFLSMLVPGIAGVMWADYYIINKSRLALREGIHFIAIVAWLLGALVSWYSSRIPLGLPPINSIVAAAFSYLVLHLIFGVARTSKS
ncbi:MAG: cytosine permease [Dethiosulfovibrio peptidovorans]|nr:MAG: cytosine permease [Dethiosulfovibrio peptidovorans]